MKQPPGRAPDDRRFIRGMSARSRDVPHQADESIARSIRPLPFRSPHPDGWTKMDYADDYDGVPFAPKIGSDSASM